MFHPRFLSHRTNLESSFLIRDIRHFINQSNAAFNSGHSYIAGGYLQKAEEFYAQLPKDIPELKQAISNLHEKYYHQPII